MTADGADTIRIASLGRWGHLSEESIDLERLDEASYQRLKSELTAPTYRFTSAGKVQLQAKEELRQKGLPSPDAADAFVMWNWAKSRATRRIAKFGAVA